MLVFSPLEWLDAGALGNAVSFWVLIKALFDDNFHFRWLYVEA